jgi:GT2 family glycosyltransferase
LAPLISVVIPNYNGARFLEACLGSLARQTYRHAQIVVVDNGSTDDSIETVRRLAPDATLVRLEQNLGFAGGVNAGVSSARGEWVAVLNNDTEAAERWLEEAAGAIERHPDASFLACRILDLGDRSMVYSAGDCFLRAGVGYRRGQERPDGPPYRAETEVFAACGCAALYRKAALEAAGGFDESFFAYLEDVDLGLRLRAAGLRGYYIPAAEVFHHGGGTSGGEFAPLAVRLRTRNAVLVLVKSVPAAILLRSLPMILAVQASWLARCLARGRLWSWLRGAAAVLPRLPGALRQRSLLRPLWGRSRGDLWREILRSEAMAAEDFAAPAAESRPSLFLHCYFRLFG